jgi:uncharacterized membrane protein
VYVEVATEIDAPAERVWAVLADVEHWPDWTPTMTSVRLLTAGPLGPGSSAEIRQPKLPKAVWTVTGFEAGRRFEWAAGGPGVTTRGDHRVEPLDGGRCRVTLVIESTGPLAGPLTLLLGSLTRRYVSTEGRSLKQHCETASRTP